MGRPKSRQAPRTTMSIRVSERERRQMQMISCFLQRAGEHQRDSWKAVQNILRRG